MKKIALPINNKRKAEEDDDNVFGGDDSEEEEDKIQFQQKKKGIHSNANSATHFLAMKLQQDALKQDANAFKYDEWYDDIQKDRVEREQNALLKKQEEAGKSKYIARLVEVAEQRKKDQQRARDRKMAKELEKEKEQYGITEVFITSAYKNKLQEEKRWEEEERKRKEDEERNMVSRHGMSQLVRNMLDPGAGEPDQKATLKPAPKPSVQPVKVGTLKRPRSPTEATYSPSRTNLVKPDNSSTTSMEIPETTITTEPAKLSKQDTADTVQSARERYLQRMAQRKQQ